ncbi:MAG: rhodanese-like domain-containing protein [Alphaproteobacteria bacterium]
MAIAQRPPFYRDGRRLLRYLLAAALVAASIFLTAPGRAEESRIDADEAHRRAAAGEILLIDIRTPREWRRTGLPADAARATLRAPHGNDGFLDRIERLTGGQRGAPVALICAAGVRSAHATRLLRQHGYTAVLDVHEGMLGNGAGAGWLKRDLPVRSCDDC